MDKIYTSLKSITKRAVFDFVNDQIKSVIALISLSFFSLCVFIFREHVLKILTSEIQIWMVLFIALFLYLVQKIYIFKKSKTKHKFIKYGLKWVAKIKNKQDIKIQGPFCTKCGYQLSDSDSIKNNECPNCFKKYSMNEDTIDKLKDKVLRIVEADLRVGNVLNIDLLIYEFPNSDFSITNYGSFIVKDINVEMSIDISGKQYNIGTYSINSMSPDETKKTDDFNPMYKLNKILNDLELIETQIDLFDDFIEDERGKEIKIVNEFKWYHLIVDDFSSQLNISIAYSLRKKRKSTKAKYSLKFKHLYMPPEYPNYGNNFKVSLNEME